MIKQNLHTHTRFSDGADTLEEMTLAAIALGFDSLGFSEHAYTPYDTDCCIKEVAIPEYFAEFDCVRQKYSDKIELFLGFECDSYFNTPKDGLDFTIGSSHYVFNEKTNEYLTIDYKHETFVKAIQDVADGDITTLLKIYYDNLTDFVLDYKPDIIGHMDLIQKLNVGNRYFHPKSAWYQRILDEACEKVKQSGAMVEVNTGGIARGYVSLPYPSLDILSRLFELKVPITVASDSHSVKSLNCWFSEAVELIKKSGYRSIKTLTTTGFIDTEI